MNPENHDDPRALAQGRLQAMVGRGELSLAEFSDRAARIWAATCPTELEVALSGIPAPQVPASRSVGAITVDQSQQTTSIFDTLKREGRWTLPDDYRLTSWMGDIYLDAREAVVDRPSTRLQLDLWGADARILLPPGVSVAVTGNRTMTDLKIDEGRYEVRDGPHLDLVINGFLGSAKLKILAAGEKIPKTWKWF